MNEGVGGWMDGWMDESMDEVGRWINRQVDGWRCGWEIDGWINRQTHTLSEAVMNVVMLLVIYSFSSMNKRGEESEMEKSLNWINVSSAKEKFISTVTFTSKERVLYSVGSWEPRWGFAALLQLRAVLSEASILPTLLPAPEFVSPVDVMAS